MSDNANNDYGEGNARKYCALPRVEPRRLEPGMDGDRLSAIVVMSNKWTNGTELRYTFVEEPPVAADLDVVRNAFATWKGLPIGLRFKEVQHATEAEIRIGFDHDDGSWSYLGREILQRPLNQKTMSFGWTLSEDSYGRDTALHEIGHTMGLPHEHQNPKSGIVWDEQAVLNYFRGFPNFWPDATTEWNILRKLAPDSVQGSTWDDDSIMHYGFPAGLITLPEEFQTNALNPAPDLSDRDVEWVKTFYPSMGDELTVLKPFRSKALQLQPGDQADFVVRPQASRTYRLQTFGRADTVMVLFEQVDDGPPDGQGLRYVAGDDDSGTNLNARISARLVAGRTYVVRLRLYWSWESGETAVMMW